MIYQIIELNHDSLDYGIEGLHDIKAILQSYKSWFPVQKLRKFRVEVLYGYPDL